MAYYKNPEEDTTVSPYRRTVGHECEYSSRPTVADLLREKGYGTPALPNTYGSRRLHNAGCRCQYRDDYPIHTTADCTAPGGEYLIGGSRGVLFGSPAYIFATKVMAEAAKEKRCGIGESVGMHTHVGCDDLTYAQKVLVLRTYLRYEPEIQQLAAGPHDAARNNDCTSAKLNIQYCGINSVEPSSSFWTTDETELARSIQLPSRPTLNFNNEHTIEFRVWNATRAQWRMVLAAAVSSAIVESAHENRRVDPNDNTTLVDFLKGLLTPDVVMLIQRQKGKFSNAS